MNIFSTQFPYIIAGPCSAETEEQMMQIATALKNDKVQMIRAGVWKPRTKPGFFEGMGEACLPWLEMVKQISGKPVCIEVANARQVEMALKHQIDCLWIGARSTVSPFIVQEIADAIKGVPVAMMVKNPINPDVDLWQGALERIANAGITNMAAIHRGFSSYNKDTTYRNEPNWAIPIELKRRMPNLPILCDPSHITGNSNMVEMVCQRAMDLHFDGLMIETHPHPSLALSDAAQQITPAQLLAILDKLTLKKDSCANTSAQEKIEELRNIIDNLDAEVVDLLARRMAVAEQIGTVKHANNISIYQPERWREVVNNRTSQGVKNNLSEEFILKIFAAIHDLSIKKQLGIGGK